MCKYTIDFKTSPFGRLLMLICLVGYVLRLGIGSVFRGCSFVRGAISACWHDQSLSLASNGLKRALSGFGIQDTSRNHSTGGAQDDIPK